MDRPPSCCDFCGENNNVRECTTDFDGIVWYACPKCASLIHAEEWAPLVERSLEAYARIRSIPDGDEPILRAQVEHLVDTFRAVRPVAV